MHNPDVFPKSPGIMIILDENRAVKRFLRESISVYIVENKSVVSEPAT
jgi:hypothetical protein